MFRSFILSSALYAVSHAAQAAYFLENNAAGSNIVALQLNNGMPSNPIRTSTGGHGAYTVNTTADTLGAQGSVTVYGNKLFTVNAGSNTLAYFEIDEHDPFHPRLVTTVDTLGEFPISTTYSEEQSKVCVLNGGAKNGVACFNLGRDGHLSPDGPLRPVPINETTPPTGPPGSAAQVKFIGKNLVAAVKGDPSPGSLVVFDGNDKRVYQNPDILFDFGFVAINESAILITTVTDAYIIDIDSFAAQKIALNGSATCWVARNGNDFYVADAGKSVIYTITNGQRKADISVPKSGGGVFDTVIVDNKLSSLVAANGIITVDLANQQQSFLDLSSFGDRMFYQGLAVWPSRDEFTIPQWPDNGWQHHGPPSGNHP